MQHTTIRYWDGVQAVQSLQDFSGTPSEAMLQGLQSNTAYRVQAVWMDDQTELAFSNIAGFRTLGAGTITLQLHNISRDNYSYRVQYLFSSTYTLSSATLSTNGQTFTGSVSGNVITFIVTGLTAGDSYLYQVTAEDIYHETATDTGTIVTTVINQVNIYYDSRTENSVTFDLSYLHDYAMVSNGWIDVWYSTQDPSTDQSISHEAWYDGDTQVTVTGLTYETTYKFRAAMVVDDGFGNQTTVYSSVVTATTADHDYSIDYFTIINEYAGTNNICFYTNNNSGAATIEISTDNGATWVQKTASYNANNYGTSLGYLSAGGKMLVRHSGAMSTASVYNCFRTTKDFSVRGNLTSLTEGIPTSNAVMPTRAFASLFRGASTLVSAGNLKFDGFANVGEYGCYSMFFNCTAMTDAPSLPITRLNEGSYSYMFQGCSSLSAVPSLPATQMAVRCYEYMFNYCYGGVTTAPSLPATVMAERCYQGMFQGCYLRTPPALGATELAAYCYNSMFSDSRLTTAPSLPATVMAEGCYQGMFNGCGSLSAAPSLPAKELAVSSYTRMFSGCISLLEAPDIRHVDKIYTSSLESMFNGCTRLKAAYAPTVDFANAPTNAFNNWLNSVAASGTLYADSSIASTIPTNSTSGCPSGWSVATN